MTEEVYHVVTNCSTLKAWAAEANDLWPCDVLDQAFLLLDLTESHKEQSDCYQIFSNHICIWQLFVFKSANEELFPTFRSPFFIKMELIGVFFVQSLAVFWNSFLTVIHWFSIALIKSSSQQLIFYKIFFYPHTDVCEHWILSTFPIPVKKYHRHIYSGVTCTYDPCNSRAVSYN